MTFSGGCTLPHFQLLERKSPRVQGGHLECGAMSPQSTWHPPLLWATLYTDSHHTWGWLAPSRSAVTHLCHLHRWPHIPNLLSALTSLGVGASVRQILADQPPSTCLPHLLKPAHSHPTASYSPPGNGTLCKRRPAPLASTSAGSALWLLRGTWLPPECHLHSPAVTGAPISPHPLPHSLVSGLSQGTCGCSQFTEAQPGPYLSPFRKASKFPQVTSWRAICSI